MTDKRKPMAFGAVQNITPAFVDGAYFFNDGRVDSAKFYLNGHELTEEVVDCKDLVELDAFAVPMGRYATCRAYAALKFARDYPAGLLTADVVSTGAGMFLPPEESEHVSIEPLFTDEAQAQAEVRRRVALAAPVITKTAREVIVEFLKDFEENTLEAEKLCESIDAAGFAIVPKEPTEAMIDAYFALCSLGGDLMGEHSVADAYRAMIAAAETQP